MPLSTSNSSQILELKRLLVRMFWFAAGLVVILACADKIVDAMYERWFERQAEELVTHRVHAELVVLGSSQTTHGIQPQYLDPLGLSIYSFGLLGAGPSYFVKWYPLVFKELYPKPRVIVYQVDWFMLGDVWVNRPAEQDSEYLPWRLFLKLLWKGDMDRVLLLQNRFRVLKMRDQLETWNSEKEALREGLKHFDRGFIPAPMMPKNYGKLWEVTIRPEKVREFNQLLDYFKSDGALVILVQPPIYLPPVEGREDIAAHTRLVRDIARSKGIPFLDYNSEKASSLNYDKDAFADTYHLGMDGGRRFSIQLEKDLRPLLSDLPPEGSLD